MGIIFGRKKKKEAKESEARLENVRDKLLNNGDRIDRAKGKLAHARENKNAKKIAHWENELKSLNMQKETLERALDY
jgi:hypothetical protein